MSAKEKPNILKTTVEHAMSEYEEEVEKLEEFFFELEKIKPIDFQEVYIFLPLKSRRKRKALLWGFSLARRCNSRVCVVTEKTKKIEDVLNKVSRAMGVSFEIVSRDVQEVLKKIEPERNIVIIPKDMIEEIKGEEKHRGPVVMV